jgi:hypothetical protein
VKEILTVVVSVLIAAAASEYCSLAQVSEKERRINVVVAVDVQTKLGD